MSRVSTFRPPSPLGWCFGKNNKKGTSTGFSTPAARQLSSDFDFALPMLPRFPPRGKRQPKLEYYAGIRNPHHSSIGTTLEAPVVPPGRSEDTNSNTIDRPPDCSCFVCSLYLGRPPVSCQRLSLYRTAGSPAGKTATKLGTLLVRLDARKLRMDVTPPCNPRIYVSCCRACISIHSPKTSRTTYFLTKPNHTLV